MPKPKEEKIEGFWLTKKHKSWCRTWYDSQTRQTKRESLGTEDHTEAMKMLVQFVTDHSTAERGRPEDVQIDRTLTAYWNEHAQFLPSAHTQRKILRLWQKFWEGKNVSEITVATQKQFRAYLGEGRLAPSSVDRMLSVGRAALNRAVEQEMLLRAPKIIMIESDEERQSRPQMGRPIIVNEMALLFKAAKTERELVFMLLLANTLARPGAIYELRRLQFDATHDLLLLNPPGRKQNKKHRPIVPVTRTLRPWLARLSEPKAFYIRKEHGPEGRLVTLRDDWDELRNRAGLPDVTPYSFRHGMSRELRKRRVPLEEIKLFLGHKPVGSDKTTEIYAPFDPDYCTNAKRVIDEIMDEIVKLANLESFSVPAPHLEHAKKIEAKRSRPGTLSPEQQVRLKASLERGVPFRELYPEFQVSTTTITNYRKKWGLGDARKREASLSALARRAQRGSSG